MLYIFDLGNVIVDIDFNRVLGAWSDLTRIPLASLKKSFHMGEAFHRDAADHIYLSQDLGMRKPEARIYQHVLQAEGFSPSDTVFFDDNADNIEGANQLGITSILVKDKTTIPDYFAKVLC